MSTGLYPESVSLRGKSNSLRPMNRPNSAGNSSSSSNGLKSKRKSSPLQKISNMFKRDRNAEDPGHIPVRPSCFADDDRFQRRSESPDGSSGKKRASSIGTTFKVNKKTVGKEGRRHALWRPRHSKVVTDMYVIAARLLKTCVQCYVSLGSRYLGLYCDCMEKLK